MYGRTFFHERQRKTRSDIWFTVPGTKKKARFVPIETCEWLQRVSEAKKMPIGITAWAIIHNECKRLKGKPKMSDIWAKYKHNGHRRITIYVDVPLGQWLDEICKTQHRSLNYVIVSLLKSAHNLSEETGELPDCDLTQVTGMQEGDAQ